MAYNFPDAPSVNQVFQDYKWDGQKWILALGGIPSLPQVYRVVSSSRAGNVSSVIYDDGTGATRIV